MSAIAASARMLRSTAKSLNNELQIVHYSKPCSVLPTRNSPNLHHPSPCSHLKTPSVLACSVKNIFKRHAQIIVSGLLRQMWWDNRWGGNRRWCMVEWHTGFAAGLCGSPARVQCCRADPAVAKTTWSAQWRHGKRLVNAVGWGCCLSCC